MSGKIIIAIQPEKIEASLFAGRKKIDQLEIKNERQLSLTLLPQIDKLLKKDGFSKGDIGKIEVVGGEDENYTTPRVIKAIAKTWQWAVSELKKGI